MWPIRLREGPRRVATILAIGMTLLVAQGSAQNRGLVIKELSFHGNHSIPSEVLAASIGTTNSDWSTRVPVLRDFRIGEEKLFDQRQFLSDVIALKVFYQSSGFPDVKVDTTITRTDGEVRISIGITEGDPIRVGRVIIDGARGIEGRRRVVRDLPIAQEDIFNRWVMRVTADTLTARLKAIGYPLARVSFTWDTLDHYRVRISFQMTPGPYAVFGPIAVLGSERVDSAFIVSLLTLRPGQPYRDEELYRSQFTLNATRLFEFVKVSIDTVHFPGLDSTRVPILVQVQEGKMFATQASAGWASTDCFRLGAGWTGRNLLGNRALDIRGQLSKIGVAEPFNFGACKRLWRDDPIGSRKPNYSLEAALRENAFLSPDNILTLSVFRQRSSEYKVYNREETGGAIAVTRETWSRIPVTLSYRVAYGQTNADAATFCGYFNSCTSSDIAQLRRPRTLATISLSASRSRVNNPLDPSRGTVFKSEASLASRWIGSSSDQQFLRLSGDFAGYVPLSRSVVLAAHLRAGMILAPKLSLEEGRENFIPPDQRFYAGGPNDVRGYQRNEMGPVVYVIPNEDADLAVSPAAFTLEHLRYNAIGGDRVFGFSTELRTPSPVFSNLIRLAAFVDMGALSAWRGSGAPLRITPGAGIRVILPRFAPIRLDVAYNAYGPQAGALYTTSNPGGGDLVLLRENFRRRGASHLTFHLAFGQAW